MHVRQIIDIVYCTFQRETCKLDTINKSKSIGLVVSHLNCTPWKKGKVFYRKILAKPASNEVKSKVFFFIKYIAH